MITSIVLTGMYNIGISDTGKIKTPDGVTISIKDIPFVRYRFDTYGEKELDFIKKNKEKFPCVHLVELTLNDDTVDIAEAIEEMDENIARIVYVPVTDAEVSRGLTDKQLELLGEVGELEIDRIMIKDKSNSMYELALDKLKKQVKEASGYWVLWRTLCILQWQCLFNSSTCQGDFGTVFRERRHSGSICKP